MKYLSNRKACEILGVHPNTLRNWADSGKIEHIVTPSGQRKYNIDPLIGKNKKPIGICYCRVSSPRQREALSLQVVLMQSRYPEHEIVKDIGGGLNFKRRGLRSILKRLLDGDKLELVVADKERLASAGFDLIEYLVEQNGGKIVVLEHSPKKEMK